MKLISFKGKYNTRCAVNPDIVNAIIEINEDSTAVHFNDGFIEIHESYDDVMKKLTETE